MELQSKLKFKPIFNIHRNKIKYAIILILTIV